MRTAIILITALFLSSCGVKGPPLPPETQVEEAARLEKEKGEKKRRDRTSQSNQ
ncbi:MAG: lipoprotein [Bdellovibrionota bacterium]